MFSTENARLGVKVETVYGFSLINMAILEHFKGEVSACLALIASDFSPNPYQLSKCR